MEIVLSDFVVGMLIGSWLGAIIVFIASCIANS